MTKCKGCNDSIGDVATYAHKSFWHPNCFVCTSCGISIQKEYQEHEDKQFCTDCYSKQFNPKCHECQQTIVDQSYILASDQPYHSNCFHCSSCKCEFIDNKFYWLNDAYCLDCHWGERLRKLNEELEHSYYDKLRH